MTQHSLMIQILSYYKNYTAPHNIGKGVCFGISLTVLAYLFSNRLDDCEQAINSLEEYFPNPSQRSVMQKVEDCTHLPETMTDAHYKYIEGFNNIDEMLLCISIMQSPADYKHLFENTTNQPDFDRLASNQRTSIPFSMAYVMKRIKKYAVSEPILLHNGFSSLLNAHSFTQFIHSLGETVPKQNANFGCIFIEDLHATGCAYDKNSKQWILIEINPTKIIRRVKDYHELATAGWALINQGKQERGIYIVPMTSQFAAPIIVPIIEAFAESSRNAFINADPVGRCELYATSYYNGDVRLRQVIRTIFPELDTMDFPSFINRLTSPSVVSIHSWLIKSEDIAWSLVQFGDTPAVNEKNAEGATPLIFALQKKDYALSNRLLERPDLDLMITDNHGHQAIYYAAENAWNDIFMRIIEMFPDDLHAHSKNMILPNNETLLHFITRNEHLTLLQLLISKKIDINVIGTGLDTALHIACRYGLVYAADMLLSHPDIDINAENAEGKKPLYEAIKHGYPRITRLIMKKLMAADTLKEYIVDSQQKWTILHCASAYNDQVLTKQMIGMGSNVNQPSAQLATPLHIAAMHGKMGIVKILVTIEGIDLNAKNDKDMKPDECEIKTHARIIRNTIMGARQKMGTATGQPFLISSQGNCSHEAQSMMKKRNINQVS